MKKTIHLLLTLFVAFSAALLAGCATKGPQYTLYDFGSLKTASAPLPALAPVSISDARAPAWLDSTQMYFRLNYANDQEARAYAISRWSMPPPQLFTQRLKARIAQAGGTALTASDGATNVPVLRIELDDFTQVFEAPGQNAARIGVRAALFNGRALVAQRSFVKQLPASSADAAGGARALADAGDAVIAEMMAWLATLPPTAK
ncbi:ABC transporter [Noviherbaspirillum cavernae]|uniref:ABC transporter n=1 Tax=Noviherbaspirillum cavernae TaxID=2320862 RepID=A0A418WXM8_9BURK|nr:ABC-type transport auxiliary lipoprotein family protein [Noviherbaspirillum cavernae]RJG04873.1 ABC transporter [Noviherbaspirillum cavernae]